MSLSSTLSTPVTTDSLGTTQNVQFRGVCTLKGIFILEKGEFRPKAMFGKEGIPV